MTRASLAAPPREAVVAAMCCLRFLMRAGALPQDENRHYRKARGGLPAGRCATRGNGIKSITKAQRTVGSSAQGKRIRIGRLPEASITPLAIHRPLSPPAPAGLRHSDPPGIPLPAARLIYAGIVRSCSEGCRLSNFCPIVQSVSPSVRVQISIFCLVVQSFIGPLIACPPLSRMAEGLGVRLLCEGRDGFLLGLP